MVSSISGRGGSGICVLVEMVGGNEFLESLAFPAKEFALSSKANVKP